MACLQGECMRDPKHHQLISQNFNLLSAMGTSKSPISMYSWATPRGTWCFATSFTAVHLLIKMEIWEPIHAQYYS